jgi:Spy/CpxP family protein refolding chaperone
MMKLINDEKRGTIFMLALFLLLLIFSPAQFALAQEGPAPPQGQPGDRGPEPEGDLVRQLNLTPEQIEKIRAIREQNREMRRQIGQRIRAARMALDRAIYLENADEGVVEQRARELAEAQGAQVRLQAMVELGVRRILTPEQLETFRALRARAERGRRDRRRQNPDGGPPSGNRDQPMPGAGGGLPSGPRPARP